MLVISNHPIIIERLSKKNLMEELKNHLKKIYQRVDTIGEDLAGVQLICTELDEVISYRFFDKAFYHSSEEKATLHRELTQVSKTNFPRVLTYKEVVDIEGYIGYKYDLCRLPTINQHLKKHSNLRSSKIDPLLRDLATVINALKEESRFHGGLNTNNIHVGHEEKIYLTEPVPRFITSKLIDKFTTYENQLIFPKEFIWHLPAEVLEGGESSLESDIFSIGSIFYLLLSPTEIENPKKLQELLKNRKTIRPPRIDFLRPEFPAYLGKILDKATHPDIEYRFNSPNELIQAIDLKNDFFVGTSGRFRGADLTSFQAADSSESRTDIYNRLERLERMLAPENPLLTLNGKQIIVGWIVVFFLIVITIMLLVILISS
jgi:Protein tyrosine and serine/threonine kinase